MLQIVSMIETLNKIGEHRLNSRSIEISKEIRRILNDAEDSLDDLLRYLEKYN